MLAETQTAVVIGTIEAEAIVFASQKTEEDLLSVEIPLKFAGVQGHKMCQLKDIKAEI